MKKTLPISCSPRDDMLITTASNLAWTFGRLSGLAQVRTDRGW
jgi:hypothetical protein